MRRRKSVIKRLMRKSLFNPFPKLHKWTVKEVEESLRELEASGYINTKLRFLVLSKMGKKRLLQLQS